MNLILSKNKFLNLSYFLLFFVALTSKGQNLLNNGDFESGGVGVGFNINGSGYNQINAPFSGVTSAGNYAFTTNPQPMNILNFITGFDHTTGTGTGNMMVIDGNGTGGNQRFWQAGNTGGGVCGLTIGATYRFSYWIKSVSTTTTDIATQAFIDIQFNNASNVTLLSGSKTAPLPIVGWVQVVYTFVPTNACVNIELWNTNTNPVGNDFAVDDFAVRPPAAPLSIAYSLVNPSCSNVNDGFISVYGVGGTASYTTYNLTGAATTNNTLGIFPNLAPGTYNVSVTDTAGTTVIANNITITAPSNPLVLNPTSATSCPGVAVNLSATATGAASYTWSANPTDASLTNPNLQNQSVSPLVTTDYTVVAPTTTTQQLLYNGDFSLGNIGFTTDYQYLNPTNATGVQTSYGVLTNASTWFPTFSACGDHTNGSGNMMVVDGSNTNSGNNKLWCQTIPVNANQNYTFSYWIQTLVPSNQANIRTTINGVSVGNQLAPLLSTCGNWTQFSFTWNSATATSAQICLFDLTTSTAGNDFAIDDLSFTTTTSCSNSRVVNVLVNPRPIITQRSNEVYCSNFNVLASTFLSNTTSTYTWTNSNTSIGLGVSGSGSLPAFTATNLTGNPIIATISVLATNVVTGCISNAMTFTITINPAPIVTNQNNVSLCKGVLSLASDFTSSVAGSNFSWTNDNTAIGLASSGNGNIPAFLPINNTAFPIVANISVTATNTATICPSVVETYTITVHPLPILTPTADIVLCSGEPLPASNFTTNVLPANITYSWTNDNLGIGYDQSGTGNLPSILGVNNNNNSSINKVATITVTATDTLTGCESIADVYTITLLPKLGVTVNSVENCVGNNSATITANPLYGAGYDYAWTVPVGIANPGNVSSFLLTAPATPTNPNVNLSYSVVITNPITGCSAFASGVFRTVTDCCSNDIDTDNVPTNCDVPSCAILKAEFLDIKQTTSYSVSSIPYDFTFIAGNPGTSICRQDDSFSAPVAMPFPFCFYGQLYNSCIIGTNTFLTFNSGAAYPNCSGGSGYAFDQPLPNINPLWRNSIYFPMQDTNPATGPSPASVSITYLTTGVAPCRVFIFTVKDMGLFSCGQSQGLQESQVKLYENTNVIDVVVKRRSVCTNWNDGSGVIGIMNASGTDFEVPPGRNTGTWATTNEAWRFTPDGPTALTDFKWLDAGAFVSSSQQVSVCPPTSRTYTAQATFNVCGGPDFIITGSQFVDVNQDPTGSPIDLNNPNNPFDLTVNEANVLNGVPNPGDYFFTYYETFQDAQNNINSITNPNAYNSPSFPKTVYVVVENFNNPCRRIKSFILNTPNACETITNGSPNQNICENTLPNSITVQTTFNTANSIRFVSFPTAQSGTTMYSGGGFIANVTPNLSGLATLLPTAMPTAPGTYYIYAIANPLPTDVTCRPFEEIVLVINPATQAGTDAIADECQDTVTIFNLNTLITGEQVGGAWTRTTGTGGNFDPIAGTFETLVGATTSTFTYTLTGIPPCVNDTSLVTININPKPLAGADGNLNICGTSTTLIDLLTIITGEQTGGTWIRNTGIGGTFDAPNGTFTPATGTTTSTFTYTKTGAPCPADTSLATVTIGGQTDAGTDGNTTICDNSIVPVDLFSLVTGEQSGGTWTRTSGTGGVFNAGLANFISSVGATTSTFTYTLIGTPPCINDESVGTINIVPEANAGADGAITICDNSNTTINLDTIITGEQTGGIWTRTTGIGGTFDAFNGRFTPANNATTSTFTYTKLGTIPCIPDSSIATININHQPNAGTNGTTTVCGNNFAVISLFNLITGEETGGIWSRASGTGGIFDPIAGTFTPALGATQSTFTYSFSGIAPCVNDDSTVIVRFNPLPTSSIASTSPSVCRGFAGPTITFSGIGGTAPYTFNYTINGTPFSITTTTGDSVTTTVNTTVTGPFTYTINSVQDANCSNIQSQSFVVNVLDAPLFNVPTAYEVCDDNATYDGVGQFVLTTKNAQITSDPTLVISYHLTQTDANTGGNPIVANPFINNAPGTNVPLQIVYVRIVDPNATQCYSTTPLQLIVRPRPLENLLLTPFQLCDVNNPGDLREIFVLSDKNTEIINGQTGSISVSYYDSQANALLGGTAGLLTNNYSSAGETIWYNVRFTATNCGTVGALELKVNALPNATQPAYAPYQLCETTAPLGIEVFNLTSKIFDLSLGQSNVSVVFYKTYNDAINNTNIIPNPTAYSNVIPYVETIGIRVTDINTNCYRVSSIDLIVNPLPLPVPPTVADLTICDDDNASGTTTFDLSTLTANIISGALGVTVTYHLTSDDATNNVNILPLLYNNINPFFQSLYVRETVTATGCFKVIRIDLIISPAPIMPLAPVLPDLTICDEDSNNQNASTLINLTQQTPLLTILQSVPSNFTVRYFETFADATSTIAGPSIFYPASYTATNNQTIWVRIENNTSKCFKVTSFKIIVNIPLLITTPAPLEVCDDALLPVTTPRQTAFDLTFRNVTILGAALPADFTVTYYTSQAGSLAGTGLIANPTAFVNTSNPQTLGVIVTSKEGCRSYTTLTINVLPLPTPGMSPADLAPQCDDNIINPTNNPVGFEYFNLTINQNYIKNSDPNVTLRYFPTQADAEAEPPTNEIKLPTNDPANALVAGDVFIRVESTLYINSAGVKCYTLVTQKLKVNPLPTVSLLNALNYPGNQVQICQNITVSPAVVSTFNLTGLIPELLLNNPTVPLSSPPVYTNTYTTTFYTSAADADAGSNAIATPSAYVSTSVVGTPQPIYVRVVNNQTGCVNAKGSFTIVVNPKPTVTPPISPLITCDTDGNSDGLFDYRLDILEADILGPLQPSTDFTVTFYDNYNDAFNGQNAIADKINYKGYTHDLWIKVQNNLTGCSELAKSSQIVEILPEPEIYTSNGDNTICVDFITDRVIKPITLLVRNPIPFQGPTPNTYEWYEEKPTGTFTLVGTGNTYKVDTSAPLGATRRYIVKEKSSSLPSPPLGCEVTSASFDVIQSGPAVDVQGTTGYFVTNAFESNQIVTVTTTGYGTYQYSIDGGNFQDSPIFENVTLFGDLGADSHYITVRDTEGGVNFSCEDYVINGVQTIDYPHYFTPNGDGINDTWNINGLKNQPAVIYIFNRDGKLIKQLAPNGTGWDGNYNGAQLPSTDYWFTVDFTEQSILKQFKSHFSLKR